MEEKQVPLVVDLDGTLTKTDTLFELMANFVGQKVFNIFVLMSLLARDRATLKRELAARAPIDASLLPINEDVMALVRKAKENGRPVVLATASDSIVAERVAEVCGPFDEVLSSTPGNNLKSHKKALALTERFGRKGFDYIGNDWADIAVIDSAREGFLVSPSSRLLRKSRATGTLVTAINTAPSTMRALWKTIRPHQWSKNLLVAVPALTAQMLSADIFVPLLVAFATFSLMASSVYLVNDLWDIQNDRSHPTKKSRPLASGDLPLLAAASLAPLFAAVSIVGAWLYFGANFTLVLLLYAFTTIAYSVRLKRVPLVDVFVLAGLYGVRLVAGAVAFGIPISPWLAAFATFAFLSLALVKRFVEMSESNQSGGSLPGRGYLNTDAPLIALFGVVSGFVGGVVLALYVEEPDTVETYANPLVMWGAVPVWLFWITRTWFLAHRKTLKEDPVLFAVTDLPSYVAGALIGAAFFFAR